ncbi:MAG: PAS domain-containing protein, partial [Sphingobacteriales bacterium]
YKKQNYSIVIAALVPWITNIAYLVGVRPFGHIDVTPFAFIIATFLIFMGIYRFKLFDIIPIAREKVLELMQDGFFVLDQQNRIIDYNKSTNKFINIDANEDLIGKNIEEIFPNQTELLAHINNLIRLVVIKAIHVRRQLVQVHGVCFHKICIAH